MFQIPKVQPTTHITIRFPNDVLESVKNSINGKNCTISAFVIAAVCNALEQLEGTEDE